MTTPRALFESFVPGARGRSFLFDGLTGVLVAHTPAEVLPLLAEVERAVAGGLHAAGFVTYEAAAGLDPALPTHPRDNLPLAWFGLFTSRNPAEAGGKGTEAPCRLLQPQPDWDAAAYAAAFAAVKAYIAAGDCYQVNLTFRQHFRFSGAPFSLYRRLCQAQPAAFCAWLDLGEFAIASSSPELFFARHGDTVAMRPMKGTARRGRDPADDRRRRAQLAGSAKERAENLMIVDLVRNDLGKVACTGSVQVPDLFCVESLPTLHQMTSTVTARLKSDTSLAAIFAALFPCGSVTGAPKRRSMAIIHELENGPRGLYCGALGFISPGGEMVFSVAIRTAVLDVARGRGVLGIGSGITADAVGSEEYRECLDKGAFLTRQAEPLQLIETLRWQPGAGFQLLTSHLQRLAASAAALGFHCDLDAVERRLHEAAAALAGAGKVRLLLAADGSCTVTAEGLPAGCRPPVAPRVALSATKIDADEPLLYHKTTWRPWYDGVLAEYPGCLDVLFCNRHDEVTEGTLHNLVVEKAGRLVTPPLACGLLPGTLRGTLLLRGVVVEETVSVAELQSARRLWLINSVRGWRRVVLA